MNDHYLTMTSVGVAELKAKLSEYLRNVRKGHDLVVLDRDQPIARLIPYAATAPLVVREPVKRYNTLGDIPLPAPVRLRTSAVGLLLEDRRVDE